MICFKLKMSHEKNKRTMCFTLTIQTIIYHKLSIIMGNASLNCSLFVPVEMTGIDDKRDKGNSQFAQ